MSGFFWFVTLGLALGLATCAEEKFHLDDETRQILIKEKWEDVFFDKQADYHLKNPLTKVYKQCFAKLKPGQSIDFVIDVAPSPSMDEVDRMVAKSPMALFYERYHRTPSRAYFTAIQLLIDAVTLDVKPELCHSIVFDKAHGQKFFLRGRAVDDVEATRKLQSGAFEDKSRNLKTLWPTCTKEVVSKLDKLVKNNLGRMTKLALWNRDNGLPTVMFADRHSKPIFTVVISDGASGAKLSELSDDLSRTLVIDIGNNRFVDQLSWDDVKRVKGGVFTAATPIQVPLMFDTVRTMACKCIENVAH